MKAASSSERMKWTWTGMLSVYFMVAFLATPLVAVDRSRIDRALAHANLKGASIGVVIHSISHNQEIYSRNARTPLIVASNNKLVTTASALHHLGQDFTLQTRVYAEGSLAGGTLTGNLVVRGGGDPSFSERFHPGNALAPLETLARAVAQAGINRVTGALLLDDTLFDRDFIAPGWPQDQLDNYYCAPISGLAVLDNLVGVRVTPASRSGHSARLALTPPEAPFALKGSIMTTSHRSENILHIARPDASDCIRVKGRTSYRNPSTLCNVTVPDPVAYFGSLLSKKLEAAGVSLEGGVRYTDQAIKYESPRFRLLGGYSSELNPVLIVTNKKSNNHYAEQLFKLAGWKVKGQGTFATGEAAARQLFIDLGIRDIDPFRMVDGSGLSRENRFSSHTLVSLLAALYRSPLRDAFIRSLPIAGVDGSLEKRLTAAPYASRVRGKTGWIRGVSTLSGYVQSQAGEIFAFSILINDYKGMNSTMKSVQDQICMVLVDG